jgi:hypothetical protein
MTSPYCSLYVSNSLYNYLCVPFTLAICMCSWFIAISVCTPLHGPVPHFLAIYVPRSELLNQFVDYCLSWCERNGWLRHVPPTLPFSTEWIDGMLRPRACLGIVMKTKMSTPAGNRTPDWRTEESRILTRYVRGSVHIQHPVSWVLAAEYLGRSWTHRRGGECAEPCLFSPVFMTCLTTYAGDTLSSRHVSSHKTYVLFSTPSLFLPMRRLSYADHNNLVIRCHINRSVGTLSGSISSISGNNW